MVVSLFALLTSLAQQPDRGRLTSETLNQAVHRVFPDPEYKFEIIGNLEDAPVVYSFVKHTDPKNDLKNFCSALFLETEFDESKKTVKIKKSKFLLRNNRKNELAKSLEALRDQVKPLLNVDPQQIYSRVGDLDQVYASEQDKNEKSRLGNRLDVMRKLLVSQDVVLLRSLIGNESASDVLAEPCKLSNYLGITPDAMPYLNQYLSGKGMGYWDFLDPKTADAQSVKALKGMSDDMRKAALEIGQKNPISLIKHTESEEGVHAALYFVTPTEVNLVASNTIPIGESESSVTTGIPTAILSKPIEAESLWEAETFTMNSLGSMATDANVNFASWLSPDWLLVRGKNTFAWNQQFSPGLSAKLDHDWLTIYNARQPFRLSSKSWNHFFKLREMFESKSVRRKDLLDYISGLSEVELKGLEDLGSDSKAIPSRYLVLTSGIRLFKIYLACLSSDTGNGPISCQYSYDQLPKEVKKEFIGFFSSAYIWNNYMQLLHPENKTKLVTASLNIGYDPGKEGESRNFVQIVFPSNWNPIVRNSPIILPVWTKNMVP